MATQKPNKDALGKGIRSLLGNIDAELKSSTGDLKKTVVETVTNFSRIALTDISVNPKQPRKDFDENALNELAHSIKIHDIIQPITVTKLSNGKFQLISGERRFRASKIAGLKDVPAYIRQADDKELLELALLENLQREDLNAVEVALSYKRMMEELSYTQDDVADRMGKDRSTIANFIRLLKLPPDIQLAVRNGTISMGHARALISIDTIDKQLFVFKEVKDKGLSVRQTEALVRNLYKTGASPKKAKTNTNNTFQRIEDKLTGQFNTRVKLKHAQNGSGQITFDYYSIEELNKLLDNFNVTID
ncbi:MAG: ParB/RepB/Spo0J family partition protein [Bacteroidia bacterium]|nr:MAG: ParB/RepB/Spo0J family partition protein [Bacteroidia bacterium]